jgi:hypothetical protein
MKIQLKRSSVLDNGAAKQPTAEQLEYGELAVNYNATDPTVFIKASDNSIVQIAGANALTKVPGLEEVLTAGNLSSSKDILVGGSGSDPNFEITTAGNVNSKSYYKSKRITSTDVAFEAQLSDVITFKVIGNGGVALGGTIDSTTQQSQANIFLNADTGNVRAITANVTGASTLTGKVTASGGMDVTGTVDINNSLNVTEGTALTGAVTMGATLGVTGVLTATTYNLGALAALPA